MIDHKLFNSILKRRPIVVKFKLKIQKGKVIIEKVIEMDRSSIFYFIARLEEYGWKRI